MAKYRILTFDGGGIRGLLSAVLLQQLDSRVPKWRDKVDLIAGTSTGGIIALGLAHGKSPDDLRDLYCRSKIFKKFLLHYYLRSFMGVFCAKYRNKNLHEELQDLFRQPPLHLKGLEKKVLIPAFDFDYEDPKSKERRWKPKFFHNFSGENSDEDRKVLEVALYTTAAPTYFPSVDGFIDGGVIANNPSMAALSQTQDKRYKPIPKLEEISLLSIGTGSVRSYVKGKKHNWGYIPWVRPLRKPRILKLLFDGDEEIPHYHCGQILRKRYHRLNYTFPPGEEIELDDHKRIDELLRIGEEKMSKELNDTAEWLRSHWM